MPDAAPFSPPRSFFRQSFDLLKQHFIELLPLFLLLVALFSALDYFYPDIQFVSPLENFCRTQSDAQTCENLFHLDLEGAQQNIGNFDYIIEKIPLLAFFFFSSLLVSYFGTYAMTVTYFRRRGINLGYSFSSFLTYLSKNIHAFLKASLWLCLPILGIFFFAKTMMSYIMVAPLSLVQGVDELETSQDLTKGHLWLIFTSYSYVLLLPFLLGQFLLFDSLTQLILGAIIHVLEIALIAFFKLSVYQNFT